MTTTTKADLPSRYVSTVAIDWALVCFFEPTIDISHMWEEELNLGIGADDDNLGNPMITWFLSEHFPGTQVCWCPCPSSSGGRWSRCVSEDITRGVSKLAEALFRRGTRLDKQSCFANESLFWKSQSKVEMPTSVTICLGASPIHPLWGRALNGAILFRAPVWTRPSERTNMLHFLKKSFYFLIFFKSKNCGHKTHK